MINQTYNTDSQSSFKADFHTITDDCDHKRSLMTTKLATKTSAVISKQTSSITFSHQLQPVETV